MRTPRLHLVILLLATVLVVICSCTALAQDEPSSRVNGITVPSVSGAPFSATVVIEAERYWPYGFTETYRTINLIGRDTIGRTHNETRQLMPEAFHGSPALKTITIYDPRSQVRIFCDAETHVAHRAVGADPARNAGVSIQPTRVEDLGVTTLNGFPAKGTRRIQTLSKKESGMGHPIDIVDEVWHSDDLHLDLLLRHDDPRIGTNTIGLSNLKREEPPPSLFDVPSGFRILNVAPPGTDANQTGPAKP